MKSLHAKNTLLQFPQGKCAIQKLQESIFSPPQDKLKNKKFPALQKNKTSFHRTVRTSNSFASNVNRFEQSVCELETVVLRGDSKPAGNRKINAIIFLRGVVVKQSDVLLTNILQVQKMRTTLWHKCLYLFVRIFCRDGIASNPSKKLLRQSLMRYHSLTSSHHKLFLSFEAIRSKHTKNPPSCSRTKRDLII